MTSETGLMLVDVTKRMFADVSNGATVMQESQEAADRLWCAADQMGLLDALLPEALGGADLCQADLGVLTMTIAAAIPPLALADTMVARAILAHAGASVPDGPIILAPDFGTLEGLSAPLPLAAWARHALVEKAGRLKLVELTLRDASPGITNPIRVDLPGSPIDGDDQSLLPICAALAAAAMAGMLSRVLEITVKYAGERVQFGKQISAFQAVQQQLAVLAEESAAANMAAQLAFSAPRAVEVKQAAIAKLRVGLAAERGVAIAHAVIGAIGMTEEFTLQRFSRRLIDYRLAAGTEMYWAKTLGRWRLAEARQGTVAFLQEAAWSRT